jgi:hypothetical protein
MVGVIFSILDIYTREWVGYCFDLSAIKENAIISVENALVSHRNVIHDTQTANYKSEDNDGSQYTNNLPKINVNSRIKDRTYCCKYSSRTKWSHRIFSQDVKKRIH